MEKGRLKTFKGSVEQEADALVEQKTVIIDQLSMISFYCCHSLNREDAAATFAGQAEGSCATFATGLVQPLFHFLSFKPPRSNECYWLVPKITPVCSDRAKPASVAENLKVTEPAVLEKFRKHVPLTECMHPQMARCAPWNFWTAHL